MIEIFKSIINYEYFPTIFNLILLIIIVKIANDIYNIIEYDGEDDSEVNGK